METSYKEKYEKALERARVWKDKSGMPQNKQGILDDIFPELKESEDEKIRKQIVNAIHDYAKRLEEKIPTEWLAWLEKQGEQKHADSYCQENCKGFQETGKCFADGDCKAKREAEQKPEENKGNLGGISPNSAWSEEDEQHVNSLLKRLEGMCKKGATFTATRFAVSQDIDWLKSFQDRVQPQPKQEWSEEDEEILRTILSDGIRGAELDMLQVNWLKSLKPQNRWKPSDEHIKVLNEVLNFAANHESPHWNDYIFGTLNNLIRQLKKLMEE